jgi:hypothetical protein
MSGEGSVLKDGPRVGAAERRGDSMGKRVAGEELARAETRIEETLAALRSLDDADVEGHTARWSKDLKEAIERVEDARTALRGLEPREADVEAHTIRWSVDLKEAIERLEDGLAALSRLERREGDHAEVEAHGRRRSQRRLKQAIAMLTEALETLTAIGPRPRLA